MLCWPVLRRGLRHKPREWAVPDRKVLRRGIRHERWNRTVLRWPVLQRGLRHKPRDRAVPNWQLLPGRVIINRVPTWFYRWAARRLSHRRLRQHCLPCRILLQSRVGLGQPLPSRKLLPRRDPQRNAVHLPGRSILPRGLVKRDAVPRRNIQHPRAKLTVRTVSARQSVSRRLSH